MNIVSDASAMFVSNPIKSMLEDQIEFASAQSRNNSGYTSAMTNMKRGSATNTIHDLN